MNRLNYGKVDEIIYKFYWK